MWKNKQVDLTTLDSKIKKYQDMLDENKKTVVKVLTDNGFVDSYDKQEENLLKIKRFELIYARERILLVSKLLPFYNDKIEIVWNNYISSIVERIEFLKTQKTERIYNEITGKAEYVLNQALIDKFELMLEDLNQENNNFKLEYQISLKRVIKVLFSTGVGKVIIVFCFLSIIFGGIPILINKLITTEPPNFIVIAKNSDWIGFWASYIAGTLGATIGGLIAFKIASYQFSKQDLFRREERLFNLKLENAEQLIEKLFQLIAKIDFVISFINRLETLVKSQNLEVNTLKSGHERINNYVLEIYDLVDEISLKINTKRVIVAYLDRHFVYIQEEIFKFTNICSEILDNYESYIESIENNREHVYDFKLYDKYVIQLNKASKHIMKEIYDLENKIQSDLKSLLYPNDKYGFVSKVFHFNEKNEL